MNRILVIGMSPILGGVETYIFNLIKHIDKTKYKFDFLIIGQGKKSVFEAELNNIIGDGENHFYYAPNLKKHPVKARRWLKKFYNDHYYDLIYLNTCTSARINYCKYSLKKHRARLITHSHNGSGLSPINNYLFRGYVNRYSNYKLTCSDIAAKWLFGNRAKEAIIVPNGVDTGRFSYNENSRQDIREQLKIDNEKVVVGHVGRFSAQKNHEFFIELAKKTKKKYVFLCIGDGDLKETFEEKISSEGLGDRFMVLSSKNDVEKYYSAMDIFAMPSIFEGLPIVAVEAQASGLPCLFSTTISEQTALSKRSQFLSINNISIWVKELEKIELSRYNGTKVIEDSGFSLSKTVNMISELFDKALIGNSQK